MRLKEVCCGGMSARACWLYNNAGDEGCDNNTQGGRLRVIGKWYGRSERWGISRKENSQSNTHGLGGDASKQDEKKAIKRGKVTVAHTLINRNKAREEREIFANRLGGQKIRGEGK